MTFGREAINLAAGKRTEEPLMRRVFLDHQSTTPVLPEVFDAMKPFFAESCGSPSSLHQSGLRARDALEKAREQVAALINAESPEEIIFTSSGTESANLAVKGAAYANQRRGNHIVLSEIEHPSVIRSVEFLEKHGFTSTRVKVDADGLVNPQEVRAAITDRTILVCVHHANHDLGTIEPVREIAGIALEKGVPLFADAVASGGWLPVDVQAMGIGLLSLSPHRFYGPKGVGVLYRNRRARLTSIIHGGVQEGGLRAGTENVAALVGAGVAAEIALRELPRWLAHTAKLQKRLWEGIRRGVPCVKLNGPRPGPQRLRTNLNISAEFIEGEGLALMLDVHGIAVASGPGCVSKSLKVSPVLTAIGLDHSLAQGNVILSLGKDNTAEEIDYAVETFAQVAAKLRGMSPMWDEFQRGLVDSLIHPRKKLRLLAKATASATAGTSA
ncbi:MAG: cysteine desulfurase NifS [Verrucomicrobia bacterium]|nr:MAG: cysteine desulfurase NifS [Verrucomicrobiota bacterium]